ncbi:MAG TPA: hypothetical protein VKA43_17175 [Gammaproteobacteria bacterium]|nr:hypothetical protein [Gammaproteobacteria bacterium]
MNAHAVAVCVAGGVLAPAAALGDVVDFEAADVGSVPTGWAVAMTSDGGQPRWEIVRDATSPVGERVLAQVSDDRTSGRFPLAIYDDVETVDGSVTVRFKPISGRIDQAAGLVWRYRDPGNYYIVRANALENNVVLYKVEDGRRTPLPPIGRGDDYGVEHRVPDQSWSTLAVTFSGTRFVVTFDGAPLFEVEDATFTSAGRVGLWTKADSVTYFDGFEVIAR